MRRRRADVLAAEALADALDLEVRPGPDLRVPPADTLGLKVRASDLRRDALRESLCFARGLERDVGDDERAPAGRLGDRGAVDADLGARLLDPLRRLDDLLHLRVPAAHDDLLNLLDRADPRPEREQVLAPGEAPFGDRLAGPAEVERLVHNEDLEVVEAGEAPQELPIGLVVLLDEPIGRVGPRLLDLAEREAGVVRQLPYDVGGGDVLIRPGSCRPVHALREVVAADDDLGSVASERGFEARDLALDDGCGRVRGQPGGFDLDLVADLSLGEMEESGPNPPYRFVQQNNETDWEFLWRLARLHDFEVLVLDKTLHFRRAGQTSPMALEVGRGPALVPAAGEGDPAGRGGGRPRLGPADEGGDRGEGGSSSRAPRSASGAPAVAEAAGGGTLVIADVPLADRGEADELAQSIASRSDAVRGGRGRLPREREDPGRGAGSRSRASASASAATYVCSSTTHVFRGAKGYETHFTVSGRAPRTSSTCSTPARARIVGQLGRHRDVTQNEDPDGLGRVRVKYPALGDDTEGWWARIACPGAARTAAC